eukprot:TRINITY_DN59314_c0_g1_i1.p1 TRINITY_DN59314_c0_g1~~TRINITY_DN59314_c0_g1_i1.p1  ORF type:complete len:319 (-),score=68.56 TRINITY_DN59314_c0_g1_i1:57-1013(-)
MVTGMMAQGWRLLPSTPERFLTRQLSRVAHAEATSHSAASAGAGGSDGDAYSARRLLGRAQLCEHPGCFSRRIVVPMRRLPPKGDFSLDDLVRGRVDMACRVVNAAFFLSRSLRHNVELLLPVGHTAAARALHVSGAELRGVRPDERSIAGALRTALRGVPAERSRARGVTVQQAPAGGGLEEMLMSNWSSSAPAADGVGDGQAPGSAEAAWSLAVELCEDGDVTPAELQERLGRLLRRRGGPGTVTAFFGGGKEGPLAADVGAFRAWAKREAYRERPLRVRLGPAQLLSSHGIVLLHGLLDQVHLCGAEPISSVGAE